MSEPDTTTCEGFFGPRLHVTLSPHYDDMPLSIGGSMAAAVRAGAALLDVVIFGGPPANVQLHAFARNHHIDWGVGPAGATALREAEQARAMAVLGGVTARVPFSDAIYRDDYYTVNDELFGRINPAEYDLGIEISRETERVLTGALRRRQLDRSDVRIYAPIGIGNHVDHQILTLTGTALEDAGWSVWYYEDLPYASLPGKTEQRLADLRAGGISLTPVARVPIAAVFDAKLNAVLAYGSQLDKVFTEYAGMGASREAIAAGLTAYHSRGGPPIAEVFWRRTIMAPTVDGGLDSTEAALG